MAGGGLATLRQGVLPRGLGYLATVGTFGVAYAGLVVAVGRTWGEHSVAVSVYTFAVGFLLALILGFPLHARVQRALDSLFAPRGADARFTLRALMAEMATSTDLADLVRRALETVTHDLGLANAALFLVPSGEREFILADARGEHPDQERFAADHPLLQVLAALHGELTRRTVETQPRYARTRAQFSETFTRLGADLLLPIETEGRLVGFLALGYAPGARPLGRDEIELLRALAAEIGLCVVRAEDAERLQRARLELERFARFLPRSVANDVLGGKLPGEGGRRRAVTVVVCEVEGFAALVERVEPEELIRILGDYHGVAAEETAKQGGTLARVRGGRVVAVFGDPEPVDDHGRRAIHMAARLRRRSRETWAPWLHASPDLALRVGIASGHATVGFLAVGPRLDYHVMGLVTVTAERLAGRAGAGEIVVAGATLTTAGDDVECAPLTIAEGEAAGSPLHRVVAVAGEALD